MTTSGTYYIKAVTGSSCSDIKPVIVIVNPTPVLVITNPLAVCSPGTVDLTVAAVTAGSTLPTGSVLSYWTDAAATLALTTPAAVTTSGTYYIKAVTGSSCSDIKPVVVLINPLPVATISYPATPYCTTGTALVTRTGLGGGTYSSTTGLTIDGLTGTINLAASGQGTYLITYTFTDGTCSNTTTATVVINPLPNTSSIFHN